MNAFPLVMGKADSTLLLLNLAVIKEETSRKYFGDENTFHYFFLEDFYNEQYRTEQSFSGLLLVSSLLGIIIACPVAWFAMNKWLRNFAYKTELSW